MNAEDAVVERLDLLVGILQLAFDREIDGARRRMRSDLLTQAILDACEDGYVASGELQRTLSTRLAVSERTVRARLGELAARRVLRQEGAGRNTSYRASGLV